MVASATNIPLGQLLLKHGLVSSEQLRAALEEQRHQGHRKLLGEVLVELDFCTDEQIMECLARAYGVPFARVSPRLADPAIIPILPREYLEKHSVLPLFLVEGVLTLAVAEPANVFLVEEVERLTGKQVQVVAATAHDITSTLQAYLPGGKVFVIDDIIDDANPEELKLVEKQVQDIADLEQAAGDSPVIKLVNYILYTAVKEGASDIHIEPGDNLLRVRFRVDGRLLERLRPPTQMHAAVASRIKIMAGLDIAERRLPQDGAIHVMLDKRPIDLRVSTMPAKFGEKVVIRVVANDKSQVNLEKIGFGADHLKAWRHLLELPNGIILVTGPTGSGKSTTLYASLTELNAPDVNICTVEDPVEYTLAGINQFQVNDKANFGFPSALRALLRQDPDILMIGEIRDTETARMATQAALTGHLVLSTLHTNDAPSAMNRLFNLGIEPYLVGATVSGVLAQRLVRKLCQNCRTPHDPTPSQALQLQHANLSVPEKIYTSAGCTKCKNIGFAGRIGIYELLLPNDSMAERISAGASLQEIRTAAMAAGMVPLRHDGLDKVRAGITTMEEVFRVTA